MQYVDYGKTGLKVSRIALGGYPFSGVNKAMGWDPYSSEGRSTAIRTINTALDLGINYIDTAPGYGNGHSESIIGEVMRNRRSECYLATKVGWKGIDKSAVIQSVEDSLRRLQCDYVDVIQFHGGVYSKEDFGHIMEDGLLDALLKLKEQGKTRLVGITTEDAGSVLDFVSTGLFDMVHVNYNIIYQTAALHLLDRATERKMGVAVMRPMTSGIFQRLLESLEPGWLTTADPYEICLKFVLSDPRVHIANIGMRWPEEVQRNVEFINNFIPPLDVSKLPRLTAKIYETDDKRSLNNLM